MARPSLFSAKAWRAFESRNYRLYFLGQVVSQSGSWMQRIAQSWLVLELTDSPLALGLVTMFQFAPITLLSLAAGVWVDRLPKLQLLRAIQVLATVQAVTLAGLVLTGRIELWHVYALALLLGLISAFELPSRQTLQGEMVPREHLQSAIGLNSSVFNGARILGPAVGGAVIVWWGLGWCFAFNAATYVVALGSLLLIRPSEMHAVRRPARAGFGRQMLDGIVYAARTPQLAFSLVLVGFIGTFGFNFAVALPLLARYTLGTDADGFGLLNAAMGLGALTGALFVAGRTTPTFRAMVLAGMGFSALILVLAQSSMFVLSSVVLVLIGLLGMMFTTTANTTLQFNSLEEYRGRVMSFYTLLFAGLTPIGATVTGLLADNWGIQTALSIEACICLVATTGGWLYLRNRPLATQGVEVVNRAG